MEKWGFPISILKPEKYVNRHNFAEYDSFDSQFGQKSDINEISLKSHDVILAGFFLVTPQNLYNICTNFSSDKVLRTRVVSFVP